MPESLDGELDQVTDSIQYEDDEVINHYVYSAIIICLISSALIAIMAILKSSLKKIEEKIDAISTVVQQNNHVSLQRHVSLMHCNYELKRMVLEELEQSAAHRQESREAKLESGESMRESKEVTRKKIRVSAATKKSRHEVKQVLRNTERILKALRGITITKSSVVIEDDSRGVMAVTQECASLVNS